MIKQKILSAYEEMAKKYDEQIDNKPHNAYYDRPNTLNLIPEIKGKRILDAGCGPGKYAETLISKGGHVTGFDFSPQMVEYAQKRNKSAGKFFVHDLSLPLPMFEDASFDMVLCALALHYIEDWNPPIQEFYRILKPGAFLIISIEHPFSAFDLHKSEKYFEVEHVKCNWDGYGKPIEVNSFRRPLNECISPITNNGFYIDQIVEPKPTKEFEKLDPKHYKELNKFPAFMCLRAVRKQINE